MSKVEVVMERLAHDLADAFKGFNVRFQWNEDAGDPSFRPPVRGCGAECQARRAFAWCYLGRDGFPVIEAARRLDDQDDDRIEAISRHEMAHALQFWLGMEARDHTERGTDALAEQLWGDPIFYDHDLVQTLADGTRPRPDFLGP